LRNDARPHVAITIKTKVQYIRCEVLEHLPYSLDLSACYLHIFGLLKQALKGCRFQSDAQVKQAVHDFFQQHPLEFFEKGIQRVMTQWDTCLNAISD
jgi:hypothetical protein